MNEIVKYHNDLSNQITIKTLNANELNFFMAICSKMKNQASNEVIFTFEQLKELVKWTSNDNVDFIKSLKNTNKKLIALNFTFEDEREIVQFVLFPTFRVNKDKKTLTVKVNEDFSFLLNNLSSNFTRFELENFTTLKSKYSKYLYKELMKFKSTGYLIMTIEDFRNKLDIPEKYRISEIDKKVLAPIKEELPNILKDFEIRKIKKGRSIDKIEFTFRKIRDVDNSDDNAIIPDLKEKFEEAEMTIVSEYWQKHFPDVNFSSRHREKIRELRSRKYSLKYILMYLKEQWEFITENQAIDNKPSYFSSLILGEKAVLKDYETQNKKYYIDTTEDKIQAENFVGSLFENLEKKEIKSKEPGQAALYTREITQSEYDELYRKYLEVNDLEDNEVQKRVFKAMNANKYIII